MRQRITPAYAGKSFYGNFPHHLVMGSPPPMRGKGRVAIDNKTFGRITPAYAGKSTVIIP